MVVEDVIIIGAGPAGLAAAIQLKRYGINPLIFERHQVGGLLRNANLVENYPGFPRGITGPRLVKLFASQASNLNIDMLFEKITDLAYENGVFEALTGQNRYASRVVVIATGTRPLQFTDLPLDGDIAGCICYEVYDLLPVVGKHVAIIGGGDAAFDYALNLGRRNRVTILNRGNSPKCLPLLAERVKLVPEITCLDNIHVCGLKKDELPGLLVDCQTGSGALQFRADYLVVAIGREPQLDFLSAEFLQRADSLEQQGLLHWIGDVRNGIFRQTSIAVGDGVLAAMKIYRHLKEM